MIIEIFEYTEGDVKVNVPFDGETYLNATRVYKAFGKSQQAFSKFIKDKLTPYAERLIELDKIPTQLKVVSTDPDELAAINIVRGGDSKEQGTWFHPKLAIAFARWLSMDFEIWCDEKIDTLLSEGLVGANDEIQKVLNTLSPKIGEVQKYVRKTGKLRMPQILDLFTTMEEEAHTFKDYRTTLSGILLVTPPEDKTKMYDKLIKGTYKAYEDEVISRRTSEDVLQILNTNLIKLLRRRLNIIAKEALAKAGESTVNHATDISAYVKEISDLQDKIEELEGVLDDPRPVKFEFRTLHSVTDHAAALQKLAIETMHVSYSGVLTEDGNKSQKNFPDWKGDSRVGGTSAGIWINDGYFYLSVSLNRPPFSPLCKMDLYESPGDEDVYVGTDNVKRHFTTFNKVTGDLIVYRKK